MAFFGEMGLQPVARYIRAVVLSEWSVSIWEWLTESGGVLTFDPQDIPRDG